MKQHSLDPAYSPNSDASSDCRACIEATTHHPPSRNYAKATESKKIWRYFYTSALASDASGYATSINAL